MGRQLTIFDDEAYGEVREGGSLYLKADQIARMVDHCAHSINSNFAFDEEEPVVMVVLLSGAVPFATQLMQKLHMPLEVRYVNVSVYGDDRTPDRAKILYDVEGLDDLEGRKVLLVDELADSGTTLTLVQEYIEKKGAESIYSSTLLYRGGCTFTPDVVGHVATISDWFYGYGMDLDGMNRNLPDIYTTPAC